MAITIIEGINLIQFQEMLDNSIKKALNLQQLPTSEKPLNSNEIRNLLGISNPTLQKMRDNGAIPFKKIDNKIFYNKGEVLKAVSK